MKKNFCKIHIVLILYLLAVSIFMQMRYISNNVKCRYLFQEIFGNPQLNIRYWIYFRRVDFQHKFPKQHTISQFQWQLGTIHHPFRTGILLGIPNKIWFIFQVWKYKSTKYLWKLFINLQWNHEILWRTVTTWRVNQIFDCLGS